MTQTDTQANAYRTAITRSKLSTPMQWLADNGRLFGRMLDYGCGKGSDAAFLNFDATYDPHFQPRRPKGKFDVITCNYVLNVVTPEVEREILQDIKSLLKKNGTAYISVRRDFKEDYISSKGTLQRVVGLTLPVEVEKSGGFCIYRLTK